MAMVQNQLHSSLVKDLEAALTSTSTSNHGADNGFNKDKTIPSTSQKGDEPKIMNTTENNLIKIIPYEANITKVWHFFHLFMKSDCFLFLVIEKVLRPFDVIAVRTL